jgi:uncharacterized delta-60 repeat protein
MRRFRSSIRTLAAASMYCAAGWAGAAGQLDTGFANGDTGVLALRGPRISFAADGRFAVGASTVAGSFGNIRGGVLRVYTPDGRPYRTFGGTGSVGPNPIGGSSHSLDAQTFDATGRLVSGGANQQGILGAWVTRTLADGTPSPTFATTGTDTGSANPLRSVRALALDRQGRILVGGSGQSSGGFAAGAADELPIIARALPDGGFDAAFGVGGAITLPAPGTGPAWVGLIAEDAQARLLAVVREARACQLLRLTPTGTPDATFGRLGIATIVDCYAVARDAQDRLLVLSSAGLQRFVDGRADPAFGNAGTARLPGTYVALAVMPDDGVAVGDVSAIGLQADLKLLRLAADGTIDATWGTGGVSGTGFTWPVAFTATDLALAAAPDGRVIAALLRYTAPGFGAISNTSLYLFGFTGDAPPPTGATAVEYVHAEFGHYFTTSYAAETAALDANVFPGWERTGQSFPVYPAIADGRLPVCRFFSGETFAPKSSHFYTPFPAECDAVSANPAWQFEALVHFLRLPDNVGSGNGTCPAGTVALYRAYNNGQGGAPNHRYTTSRDILDQMLAAGWVFEGQAATRVFACVPAP